MTEKEVLEKLDFFKQAIQKLKEERDYWREQAEENPQEVCEVEEWKEKFQALNDEKLKDAETINDLQSKIEQVRNDFTDADLECDRLKVEIERADSAYAKLAKMYNEKKPEVDSDKKYTEEDLKKLLKKASEKAHKDLSAWETQYYDLQERYNNLELTNKSLENELERRENLEEIDQVLEGKITEKEIDEIISPHTKEEEEVIKELTKPTKVVRLSV
jgi:chromosome segregation ATPase